MADDREWIVAAARRFERPLLAYVRRLLGDPHRGQDIVQDAFLQLCRQSRAEIEPRLAAWLFAVCRRRVVDVLRKENRMTSLSADPPAAANGPAEAPEVCDTSRAVLARLARLPASQQEAVRLNVLQQFSYREIAGEIGLRETHVGVLLHTALKTLRRSFAEPETKTGGI
jgi:RNA polymerase sigma-70 factor (ECF subfamily)